MTDKKIKILLVVYIAAAAFFLVAAFTKHLTAVYLSWFNLLSALVLITPWLRRYLLRPHRIEQREIVFLCIELVCIAVSLCFIFKFPATATIFVVQYLVAILHLLAAIGWLAFFMLFKIKKLF